MDPQAKKVFRYPELVEKMSKGNFEFVMELYQKCVSGNEDNVFLSPFSISAALVMVFVGARGQTQDQIRTVLRLDQIGDATDIQDTCEDVVRSMWQTEQAGLTLLTANGMYVHKNLVVLPDYKQPLQTKFNTIVNNVDFVANAENVRIEINTFVEKVTNNRIKDLVAPGSITQDTRLILVNAIYFKGDWLHKFDAEVTSEAEFMVSEGNTKMVNMMLQTDKFRYAENDDLQCSMVELPYVGERLGMYILLPKDVNGLSNLESKLNNDTFSKLLDSLWKAEVTVSLPRFKIESSFSLGDILKGMGMPTMFVPGQADLSGITNTEPLYVSAVLHKSFLEVNEEGSEAADATAIMISCCALMPSFEFRADHPFLVLIRDNCSGLVLFAGRVTNPME